jgi:spore coat protein CotF
MRNSNLTQKEKTLLEDALEMENLCITKYNVYADQCQDSDLKNMLFNISKNKRQHINRIKELVGQGANSFH